MVGLPPHPGRALLKSIGQELLLKCNKKRYFCLLKSPADSAVPSKEMKAALRIT
jgi:hypothetical protein